MKFLSTQELHELEQNPVEGDLLLDVRGADEFAEGHPKGSINIPHDEVDQHLSELKKHKRLIVFCRSGRRAQAAVETLKQMGLVNMECVGDGGMLEWGELGYPVES